MVLRWKDRQDMNGEQQDSGGGRERIKTKGSRGMNIDSNRGLRNNNCNLQVPNGPIPHQIKFKGNVNCCKSSTVWAQGERAVRREDKVAGVHTTV
jgi:hypothetical protein